MTQKNGTHGSAMLKFAQTSFLFFAVACMGLTVTGCTAGNSGIASAPVFPPSTLDYSSQLENAQARGGGSPYLPQGGFGSSTRGSLFSAPHSRTGGSC